MSEERPTAGSAPTVSARIRTCPEDFIVHEDLGFAPSGSGEHVFLFLQKRQVNTADLARRLSEFSGVPLRDIGYSGLKDRQALTRQWFSLGMAGRDEPDWQRIEAHGDVSVLEVARHSRKLRRGVHRSNRFILKLRELRGDILSLSQSLERLAGEGVPNYFGEQRFGQGGSNLLRARQWAAGGQRRISRQRRSLFLSTLRAGLFNRLLADRVRAGTWNKVLDGDMCILQGTRSQFYCERPDQELVLRVSEGDVHPALPLWGKGSARQGTERLAEQAGSLSEAVADCEALELAGLELSYRAARCMPDDFSWQFCDDGSLQLEFSLVAGSYATAVLAQLVNIRQEDGAGGDGSE